MLAELRVGPQISADGSVVGQRADKLGSNVCANAHTMMGEATFRGAVMIASNAVAGVAPGTAFSTTPPLTLWNPPSSGKILVVHKAMLGYVSGTLGGGSIAFGAIPSQTTIPSTGTELTPQCSLVGFPRGVGRAFTGSTVASTPTIIRPAFTIGAFLASTALIPQPVVDLVDGEIAVQQGAAICLQGIAAAGTSPLVMLSLTWEELPA